jgi:hypothetical protein
MHDVNRVSLDPVVDPTGIHPNLPKIRIFEFRNPPTELGKRFYPIGFLKYTPHKLLGCLRLIESDVVSDGIKLVRGRI